MNHIDDAQLGDGELWQQAAAGDGEAFATLYDRHKNAMRAYCARRTGSLDTADDLVSVVFLEAWRRRGDVELVDGVALPWLYGVAHRTLQRRWRTTRTHRRALQRLPQALNTPDHADDVAARIDDERHLAYLQNVLTGLSEADRDILTLCVWQGLDYASAAVALGVPIGTVRSRLARARARLKNAAIASHPPSGSDSGEIPVSDSRFELPSAARPSRLAAPTSAGTSSRPGQLPSVCTTDPAQELL